MKQESYSHYTHRLVQGTRNCHCSAGLPCWGGTAGGPAATPVPAGPTPSPSLTPGLDTFPLHQKGTDLSCRSHPSIKIGDWGAVRDGGRFQSVFAGFSSCCLHFTPISLSSWPALLTSGSSPRLRSNGLIETV